MCVSPLKGFKIGVNPSGKPDYKITSYNCDHIEYINGNWQKCFDKFVSPYARKVVSESIDIPCGYCIECKLKRSKTWCYRILMESLYHEHNYFITLTYANERDFLNKKGLPTLNKKHLQDFVKRLRDHYGKLRFFACGEYGDTSYRPHYHMILFGPEIDDLKFYKVSNTGNNLYTSEKLEKIWSYGYVVIGELTQESAAYTARYVMKKAFKDQENYDDIGVQREFLVMSNRPGIGYKYFEEHYKKIYRYDKINLSTFNGGIEIKPPRYFDNKLEEINAEEYEYIKNRRKYIFESIKSNLLLQTKLSYDTILKNRGYTLSQRLKSLKREI